METETPSAAHEVHGTARNSFLYDKLGDHATQFEAACYANMIEHANTYDGGMWNFFEAPGDVFYMAPDGPPEGFDYQVPGNGYKGHLSCDAAGIVASLYAFNRLCWRVPSERHNTLYYALREFACNHPEAVEILGAID